MHHSLTTSDNDALLSTLKCFWELESLGIIDEPLVEEEVDTILRNLQFTGTRYEINLPWKLDLQDLPNHKSMCVNCLKSLLCCLQKDGVVLQEYDKIIQEQLEKGIIEKVLDDNVIRGYIHYLPHLPVVRTDRSTTK